MTFNYDQQAYPDKHFPADRQVGWVADQVAEIIPELVSEDEKGYKSVAYARATAVIASAVSELRRDLTEEINQLKQEMQELKLLITSSMKNTLTLDQSQSQQTV